jgi:hypothetical protein
MTKTAWWIAALLLVACGGDLADGAQIEKLRLLALRADQPFAHPGETVDLRLLAADESERPLQYALATCTNPADSTVQGCLDALDGPFEPLSLDDSRFSIAISPDVLRGASKYTQSAMGGAAVVACPGEIEAGETSEIPIVCRDVDRARLPIEAFEVGVKRIFIRREDRNQNPEITRITWDGDDWPEDFVPTARACPNAKTDDIDDCAKNLRHAIRIESTPLERGVDEFGASFTEQAVVQFYATSGVYERPVRVANEPDNHWAAQRVDGQDTAQLWFVVRDDRGGVGWATRQVRVR